MASWVEVANTAAAAIGTSTRITGPEDDKTLARSLRAVWDLNRRAALREGSWNFATEAHRLPALSAVPPFGYDYQFQLPADCLRVLEVANNPGYDAYRTQNGRILCSAGAPLDVVCLIDRPEPGTWDALFVQAFAYKLALAVGRKIAGSAFDRAGVERDYRDALAASKRVDAMENPPIEREESDWVTARSMPAGWPGRI